MLKRKEQLIKEISEIRQNIKRKSSELAKRSLFRDLQYEKKYKPITDPLKKLAQLGNSSAGFTVPMQNLDTPQQTQIKDEDSIINKVDWASWINYGKRQQLKKSRLANEDSDDDYDNLRARKYLNSELNLPMDTQEKLPIEFTMQDSSVHHDEDMNKRKIRKASRHLPTTSSLPSTPIPPPPPISTPVSLASSKDETITKEEEVADENAQETIIISTPEPRAASTSTATPIRETRSYYSKFKPYEPVFTIQDIVKSPKGQFAATTWAINNFNGPLARQYVQLALMNDKMYTDSAFGVSLQKNDLKIGDMVFKTDDEDNVIILNKKFPGTKGLYELLFKKRPITYTEEDLQHYKEILTLSNVPIKYKNLNKYRDVIKPLFKDVKSGEGLLPSEMVLTDTDQTEYVYYNDVNEIVDRWKLLDASKQAGHTSHQNEINSIKEELLESGHIYT